MIRRLWSDAECIIYLMSQEDFLSKAYENLVDDQYWSNRPFRSLYSQLMTREVVATFWQA